MVLLRAAEGHLLFAGKSLDVAEMLLLLLPSSATGTIPTELVGLPAIHGATLLHHSHSWDGALPLSIGMAPGCDTAKGDFPSSILTWLPGEVGIPWVHCKNQSTWENSHKTGLNS